jgi:hypothetical protein
MRRSARYWSRRFGFTMVTASALVVMTLGGVIQPTNAQALPAGMPTHFGFGVAAGQGDTWMPQSGSPWDYRFQYLSGGVNTGAGWETWNANGAFALNYANESAQRGTIPMFPYYELFQSTGPCGTCGENQRDLANLNSASLMSAYYANFALLMKRLGPGTYDTIKGFGRTALVNIEPDFSGGYAVQAVNNNAVCFGFCTGQGNDPSLLKAAVASSGFADVAAYPNTYAGFTRALAHLRDLYAPNVVLGHEISPWAAGVDIGTDTSSSTNATALGQQVGVFLNKAGGHDVLFNDPLDRDAGQYKVQFGQNRWWDRLNVKFPNFARWEQFLKSASVADGSKSILLWQVPVGNQYFDTANNTNGHFQDNRAEYIFSHIPELIQTGIVGVMFAPGNSGSTSYTDTIKDGVTNPASFCTTDGISSGQICNNHTSTVADDDGGFIRMSAQTYYQHPVPLSGTGTPPTSTPTPAASFTPTSIVRTPTATPTQNTASTGYATSASATPSPTLPGSTVSITSSVTSNKAATVLVDLEVYDSAFTKVFQQVLDNQSFSAGQTRTFASNWQVPPTAKVGTYTVMIGVFSPGWGTLYSWNGAAGSVVVSLATTPRPTNTSTPRPTSTPTPRATSTPTTRPTNTPVRSATATPAQPSYSSTGSVMPSSVSRGGTASIAASVTSATSAGALVDVEVYSAAGVKVFQHYWDGQSFTAGQSRTFTTSWSVPGSLAPGDYTLVVAVFSPGWGTLYHWHAPAAVLKVT